MPTAVNKQKVVSQVFAALGKAYKSPGAETRPVLEQFIYAICRESAPRDRADRAFENLRTRFFDWNEVRVSANHEIAEALDGLDEREARAQRIIEFLQEVFETTFSFSLEGIEKKGLKQAAKQLARYQAANDYAVAWVVQQSLEGHAIPLDNNALLCLRRLGLLDEGDDMESLRTAIEHQIPKAKGSLFVELISHLAANHCHPDRPACGGCPLQNHCPTGQDFKASTPAPRQKPR